LQVQNVFAGLELRVVFYQRTLVSQRYSNKFN
jgi:hypothetical protein